MKRLLAISWSMLPSSAPRAMQVARLLAHLPEAGWQSEVIWARESVAVSAGAEEHTIAAIYGEHFTQHGIETREELSPSGPVTRLRRWWRPPPSVNDANWLERAVALAGHRIRSGRIDVLATFAQPWIDHLVGLQVKKKYPRLPWLAHFSDPWIDSPYFPETAPDERARAAGLERDIIEMADAVVFVTQQTADLVMRKYPDQWRRKVHIVPHGFDANLVRLLDISVGRDGGAERGSALRIVHTGSLYNGIRPATGILEAIAHIRRQVADAPIHLSFVGHNPPDLDQQVRELGLEDIVSLSGPQSWSESLRVASQADVLLLIERAASNSVFLPSKLIEYLPLRRPILGLTPDRGASSDLLRQLGYRTAPPDDPMAIASRLETLIAEWRSGTLGMSSTHDQAAAKYDMRRVARNFASLLSIVGTANCDIGFPSATSEYSVMSDNIALNAYAGSFFHVPIRADTLADLYGALESAIQALSHEQVWVAFTRELTDAELSQVLQHPRVQGVIVTGCSDAGQAAFADRIGRIDMDAGTWTVPKGPARSIIFLDRRSQFGARRAWSALKMGLRTVIVPGKYVAEWKKHAIVVLFLESLFDSVQRRIAGRLPARTPVQTLWTEPKLRKAARKALNDPDLPLFPPDFFVRGRVLIVNSSLGPGGAERQVVNTAAGLLQRGVRDLAIMCEYLTPGSEDFHLKAIESLGVPVWERKRSIGRDAVAALQPKSQQLQRILRRLPQDVAVDIIGHIAELMTQRPSVVHAWQDDTSVKAGFAAAILGVPRIILSGRSVAPDNFLFHKSYMRSMYCALAVRSNVVMINNSRAGAASYEAWLGLPPGSIGVVHNGFDFATLRRPDDDSILAYRATLGLASYRLVVGTIMRFSEEKRPMLWATIAAAIARRRSDIAFVMIGTGVMHAEVKAYVASVGLQDRIILPGTDQNTVLALSAMDLFLLTSRLEGLPNVLVEAQALGVPVVATDGGGAGETFDDGITGKLVASGDPEKIADEVLALLDDASWRERATASAPCFVRERFSVGAMIDKICALYGLSAERAA